MSRTAGGMLEINYLSLDRRRIFAARVAWADGVVTGVTACLELLERAAGLGADAVIVHHGLFWKGAGEMRVERSLRRRLALLLREEINLLAYHLPLDRHPEVGNNAVLARKLALEVVEPAFPLDGVPVGVVARPPRPLPVDEMLRRVAAATGRDPLHVPGGPAEIRAVGIVTGDGAGGAPGPGGRDPPARRGPPRHRALRDPRPRGTPRPGARPRGPLRRRPEPGLARIMHDPG